MWRAGTWAGRRFGTQGLLLAAGLAWALGHGAARAEQIVIVDEALDYRGTGGRGQTDLTPKAPQNWLTPVDYFRGTTHIELELLGKPSSKSVQFEVAFRFPSGDAGIVQMPAAREPGVYEKTISPMGLYCRQPSEPRHLLFSKGVSSVKLGHLSQRQAPPTSLDCFPALVHLRISIVPRGVKYNPNWSRVGLSMADVAELRGVAARLGSGQLGTARKAAEQHAGSDDAQKAAKARRVVEAIDGYAERRLEEITKIKYESPDYAVSCLRRLGREFAGSERGKELLVEAAAWLKDPDLAKARAARNMLGALEKMGNALLGKLGGKPASQPEMAHKYAADISAIERYATKFEEEYPDTPSYRHALSIKMRLGIGLAPVVTTPAAGGGAAGPGGRVPGAAPIRDEEQEKEPEPPPKGNLVTNGGFEQVSERTKFPDGWTRGQWGRFRAKRSVYVSRSEAHGGERALVLRCLEDGAEAGAFLALDLTPWTYELRYWACTDLEKSATVRVQLAGLDLEGDAVTEDWKQFRHRVRVSEARRDAQLRLSTSTPRVRVWLDDVELEGVAEGEGPR